MLGRRKLRETNKYLVELVYGNGRVGIPFPAVRRRRSRVLDPATVNEITAGIDLGPLCGRMCQPPRWQANGLRIIDKTIAINWIGTNLGVLGFQWTRGCAASTD